MAVITMIILLHFIPTSQDLYVGSNLTKFDVDYGIRMPLP